MLRGCVVMLVGLLVPAAAFARVGHSDAWAREKFALAQRMREVLDARPSAERTRHDYQHVIDSFRRVYLGAPSSSKADPSVTAVAELLTEMGRCFDDEKILHSAIGQYRFLRREYPGSKHRSDALFTIGEIYQDDLDDGRQARDVFEEFLRNYPNHRLADGAREALGEISAAAGSKESTSKPEGRQDASLKQRRLRDTSSDKTSNDQEVLDAEVLAQSQPGNITRVTAIQHWSTPDYTRVSIDLEQKVEFDAQRIDHPNRIFFDLHDTHLAANLAGKSFDVDDGLLKRVRVAQFQRDRTRIVLDVEGLSDYNAFLLTDPCRLIIDVRSKVTKTATNHETPLVPPAENTAAMARTAKPNDRKLETLKTSPTVGPGAAGKPYVARSVASNRVSFGGARDKKSAQSSAWPAQMPPVKKIVEADDDDNPDVSMTALEPADLRPEITPAQRLSAPLPASASPARGDRSVSDAKSENRNTSDLVGPPPGSRRRSNSRARARDTDMHEAKPTAKGDRSLIRALGLKIGKIVLDPGHGGHDAGTIGPNGLEEKDLVLGVATRLGKLLEGRLGAEVIYTRQDDTFVPLETRTAIANQEQADLFVSIHANSSRDRDARGVETYYLNFTSNPDALEVAARENAVSDKSIHELQDLVRKIALKEKIEESREFAFNVQQALHSGLANRSPAIRDRGVKKAPFIVLIGANMPSILAEISFISNPSDERKLETAEYRQRIAESLYRGIAKYVAGLSGVKVASHMANANTR